MQPKCAYWNANARTHARCNPSVLTGTHARTHARARVINQVRLGDVASLQNLVTVVDGSSVLDQLGTMEKLVDRGWQASEGDRRTVAHLLCEQIEFADVLLINKIDLVDSVQLRQVEAVVRKINPLADILRTEHGQLEPALLLGKQRFNLRRAEKHPQWLAEAREHEHTPETVEYGISSFIYRADRPFHPERLHSALGTQPRPGALSRLLRIRCNLESPSMSHSFASPPQARCSAYSLA